MYKQRIRIFQVVIAIGFAVVIVRLGYLQIVRGEDYRRRLELELRSVELLPAMRGRIVDRNGMILAMEDGCYEFSLDYRFLVSDAKWIARQKKRIASREGVSRSEAEAIFVRRRAATWQLAAEASRTAGTDLQETVRRIVRRVENLREIIGQTPREQRQAHAVATGLDEEMQVRLKRRLGKTVGASVRPNLKRWYPQGSAACHIIGLTGEVNKQEMKRLNLSENQDDWLARARKNYHYGDAIGKSGIERACERILRGRRGYVRIVNGGDEKIVDAKVLAANGRDVTLTLDIELQKELMNLLPADKNGCIVVLDVPTGEILAMVSKPVYDLNAFGRDCRSLFHDRRHRIDLPLLHRAIAKPYPPGSSAKPLSALAALAEGIITTQTTFLCRGYLYNPGAFRCFHGHAHGQLSVVEAIRKSCNVFFYNVGEKLGPQRMGKWFGKFGFGVAPGTGLPQERSGRLPPPDAPWVEARFMAIGQGITEATPLQVANAMAAIARGGRFLSPALVRRHGPQQVVRELDIPASALAAVRRGMYEVVNVRGGTAYRVFHQAGAEPLETEVCGKTGTATTHNQMLDGQVVNSGDTAWFCGFAPYRNPRIAFAVVVEYIDEGATGGRVAGPVARRVIRACKRRGYLRPN